MPSKSHNEKDQQPRIMGAANSPHFQQEGIRSEMPPKQLFSEPEELSKEEEAVQKKKSHADSGSGDIPPYNPNNNKGENNILNILQRRHADATKDEKPKQYKRFEPKNLTPRQFRKVEPFQLSQSGAYQRSVAAAQEKENPIQQKSNALPQEVQAKIADFESTFGEGQPHIVKDGLIQGDWIILGAANGIKIKIKENGMDEDGPIIQIEEAVEPLLVDAWKLSF